MAAEKIGLIKKLWCGFRVWPYALRKETESSSDGFSRLAEMARQVNSSPLFLLLASTQVLPQSRGEERIPNQPNQSLRSIMLLRLQLINNELLQGLRLSRRSKLALTDLVNVAHDIVLDRVESHGTKQVEQLGELLGGVEELGRVDSVVLVGIDWNVDEGRLHLLEERHCGYMCGIVLWEGYLMECCDVVVRRESLRQERSRWSCSFVALVGL